MLLVLEVKPRLVLARRGPVVRQLGDGLALDPALATCVQRSRGGPHNEIARVEQAVMASLYLLAGRDSAP